MANILGAAKAIRTNEQKAEGDSMLTAVKSTNIKKDRQPKNVETQQTKQQEASRASSPEDALQILRSRPDLEVFATTLTQLSTHAFQPSFNIHAPGPLQAQIISTLLNNILPDFWHVLSPHDVGSLVACLSNVAGLNAVVARLRLLGSQRQGPERGGNADQIEDVLELCDRLFEGESVLVRIRRNLHASVSEPLKRELTWKEFVNLVGSGRVTAAIAQAEDVVRTNEGANQRSNLLAKGGQYASWLGRNIATLIEQSASKDCSGLEAMSSATQIIIKSLNIGYPGELLRGLFEPLVQHILGKEVPIDAIQDMLRQLIAYSKRTFVEHLLRWLSSLTSAGNHSSTQKSPKSGDDASALAALVSLVASTDTTLEQNIKSFLADPTLSSLLSFPCRRACLVALSDSASEDFISLLEKLMSSFNDQLFISHAPIIQQESLAQTLLLVAGYLHRKMPMALLMTARSSNHMRGVSNRLDSSNAKARWLGMVVGTAISSLVDKEGTEMSFGTEDMQTDEARWYLGLVKLHDKIGQLQDFSALLQSQEGQSKTHKSSVEVKRLEPMPVINGKPVFGPPRPPAQTEVVGEKVTELLEDDSDEDDDDLKPYAKPDSDPEDSDEDATLVNRNKARPPVYIRDLMSMLRDDTNHDRFQLGIKHAASLIRRKMSFGAEVRDHAEEIAVILCNLHDPFETEDFDELRLQALIAVNLSSIEQMAPWLSKQAFVGDYSMAQRCIILSALGLSGRELAGFKNEDSLNPSLGNTEFPSKRLPPHLRSVYSAPTGSTKRLEAASQDMEQRLIKPLALQAADQSTSHLNAVKVRTFSSRMEVERTKRKPAANALAKILGAAFFYPLANHYQQELAAYGSASVFASMPIVLVTFLKTLALLFHASGPATLSLSEISGEFWDLLLSLRVQALADISVLHAVLFSLLTLLELNADKRRLVDEHPKRLMETQQWVDLVFERMGGGGLIREGGNDEETKVKTLAAAILVKAREVIEAYQKELVGYSFD
ncbi:telomere binding protein [Vermiconidia calcicola]|uniref:Telomere binding protein n=1 Tax=Vermiconidia calcicola TaxID=1690605 RepID=A0ACC3NH37_9PEZI|nr:telomere binding protein [Vermiconidia calcicola]